MFLPKFQNLCPAQVPPCLKYHRENWGFGLSIDLHPHSRKKRCI